MPCCSRTCFVAMTPSSKKATSPIPLPWHRGSRNRGSENQGEPNKARLAICWIDSPKANGLCCGSCLILPCHLTTTSRCGICACSKGSKRSPAASAPNREWRCSVASAATSRPYANRELSCYLHSSTLSQVIPFFPLLHDPPE